MIEKNDVAEVPDPYAAACEVRMGEARFEVQFGKEGVSRLVVARNLWAARGWVATVPETRGLSRRERTWSKQTGSFLEDFFAGRPPEVAPPVDLSELSEFAAAVLEETSLIPWGETRSYGEVAAAIGHPGAARAAGNALARNPVPLIVPCHRVVLADGRPGGFGMGPTVKVNLLLAERR